MNRRGLAAVLATALVVMSGCASSAGEDASVESRQTACEAAPQSIEVTVHNALGEIHGTLEVPAGCGPFPAAVIIPGSGPGDRNGNHPDGTGPNFYRHLAESLRDRGVASIRYDKASVGASAHAFPAHEADFHFEMGAEDAALWVPLLRADARIDRVTLVGHSEGAELGALAASTAGVDGYVSLAGAGRPIGVVLHEQLAAQIHDAASMAKVDFVLDKLSHGELVPEIPPGTPLAVELFRPSIQPYLVSWMRHDPAADIRAVRVPTLIVQGTTDTQVKVEDARLLAAAKPEARLSIIEGMNHVLREATLAPASQAQAYSDPNLPVVPQLVDELAAFARGAR